MKNKERLRNCFRLKETKEIQQLNVICDSRLNSGRGKFVIKESLKINWQNLKCALYIRK